MFAYEGGPCYRCLYPEPPPPGLVPSCAEGGVLGILPGVVGLMQATEAVKLILGIGEPTGELGDVLQGSLAGQGAEGLREPLAAVAWFTAVVLAAATLIYSRREYDARARD